MVIDESDEEYEYAYDDEDEEDEDDLDLDENESSGGEEEEDAADPGEAGDDDWDEKNPSSLRRSRRRRKLKAVVRPPPPPPAPIKIEPVELPSDPAELFKLLEKLKQQTKDLIKVVEMYKFVYCVLCTREPFRSRDKFLDHYRESHPALEKPEDLWPLRVKRVNKNSSSVGRRRRKFINPPDIQAIHLPSDPDKIENLLPVIRQTTKESVSVIEGKKYIFCVLCRTFPYYRGKGLFIQHYKQYHPRVRNPASIWPIAPTIKTYIIKCTLCVNEDKRFTNGACLRAHLRGVHPDKADQHESVLKSQTGYECKYCPFTSLSKHLYMTHVADHEKKQEFICDHCGKTYYSRTKLLSHVKQVHKKPDIKCQYCSYITNKDGSMKKHVKRVHFNIREFKCDVCNARFGTKHYLKCHVLFVHQKVRPYKCDICGWDTAWKKHLKTHHMTVHQGVKPFSCTTCPATFTCSTNLKRHKCQGAKTGQQTTTVQAVPQPTPQPVTTVQTVTQQPQQTHHQTVQVVQVQPQQLQAVQQQTIDGQPEQTLMIVQATPATVVQQVPVIQVSSAPHVIVTQTISQ